MPNDDDITDLAIIGLMLSQAQDANTRRPPRSRRPSRRSSRGGEGGESKNSDRADKLREELLERAREELKRANKILRESQTLFPKNIYVTDIEILKRIGSALKDLDSDNMEIVQKLIRELSDQSSKVEKLNDRQREQAEEQRQRAEVARAKPATLDYERLEKSDVADKTPRNRQSVLARKLQPESKLKRPPPGPPSRIEKEDTTTTNKNALADFDMVESADDPSDLFDSQDQVIFLPPAKVDASNSPPPMSDLWQPDYDDMEKKLKRWQTTINRINKTKIEDMSSLGSKQRQVKLIIINLKKLAKPLRENRKRTQEDNALLKRITTMEIQAKLLQGKLNAKKIELESRTVRTPQEKVKIQLRF